MKKLSVLIGICLFFLTGQAQNYVLKGVVKDHMNKPISNAEIIHAKDSTERTFTDVNGLFVLETNQHVEKIDVRAAGMTTKTIQISAQTFVNITLQPQIHFERPQILYEMDAVAEHSNVASGAQVRMSKNIGRPVFEPGIPHNTEAYAGIDENGFHHAMDQPLSTFSIDVDRASYSNIRRFLNNGQMPPKDAVRVEEMINYFEYAYDSPKGDDPVAIHSDLMEAPWNGDRLLMKIGVKARELEKKNLPPSNLVFLLDVSGSMNSSNKLPLLKSAMNMLVDELRPEDRVAIVVYAGAAGLVLESTSGSDKGKIKQAIERLSAGGSTAGGAGIKLAYKTASEALVDGNNRVILATDGDFNIGASSDGEMQRLIEEKREEGVFLTVLGFGMGNYKDSKMETLADHGNGNYAYIDNLSEARKTLVSEFGSTLFTVAKDVKIQVEFNPAVVGSYRLIGYENRLLEDEDFNDDKKDAGEMGAGHVVTALYEIVPAGKEGPSNIDPLKYSHNPEPSDYSAISDEMATVKLRYKLPEGSESQLMEEVVTYKEDQSLSPDKDLQWASSVAAFGMKLRSSEYIEGMKYDAIIELAQESIGKDPNGYRRECIQMMKNAASIAKNTASR